MFFLYMKVYRTCSVRYGKSVKSIDTFLKARLMQLIICALTTNWLAQRSRGEIMQIYQESLIN